MFINSSCFEHSQKPQNPNLDPKMRAEPISTFPFENNPRDPFRLPKMINFWLFLTIGRLFAIPYDRENTEITSKWSDERLDYFRVMQRLNQMMRSVNQPVNREQPKLNERTERRFSAVDDRLRRQENQTFLVSDYENSEEYYYYYDDTGLGRKRKKKKKNQTNDYSNSQTNYLSGQNYGPPDSWQNGYYGKSPGPGDSNQQVLISIVHLKEIFFFRQTNSESLEIGRFLHFQEAKNREHKAVGPSGQVKCSRLNQATRPNGPQGSLID